MSLLKQPNAVFFPGLNELRAFLALGVLFYHADLKCRHLHIATLSDLGSLPFQIMHNFGTYMVVAFFALSGFLITYLAYHEETITNGNFSLKNFYLRRLLRIWPLYYLLVFSAVVIFPLLLADSGLFDPVQDPNATQRLQHQLDHYWEYFLILMGMAPNLQPVFGASTLSGGHLWSIGIEEQFYIGWPLLFLLKRKYRIWGYAAVACGILLLSLITSHFKSPPLYYNALVIGGFLASVYYRYPKLIELVNRKGVGLIISTAAVLAIMLFIEKVDWVLSGFVFPVFILFYADFFRRHPFKFSWFDEMGKVSYGIYMIHPPLLHIIAALLLNWGVGPTWFVVLLNLALFASTVALSFLSYRYYEKPFLKLKDRFSKTGAQPESAKKYQTDS